MGTFLVVITGRGWEATEAQRVEARHAAKVLRDAEYPLTTKVRSADVEHPDCRLPKEGVVSRLNFELGTLSLNKQECHYI